MDSTRRNSIALKKDYLIGLGWLEAPQLLMLKILGFVYFFADNSLQSFMTATANFYSGPVILNLIKYIHSNVLTESAVFLGITGKEKCEILVIN